MSSMQRQASSLNRRDERPYERQVRDEGLRNLVRVTLLRHPSGIRNYGTYETKDHTEAKQMAMRRYGLVESPLNLAMLTTESI